MSLTTDNKKDKWAVFIFAFLSLVLWFVPTGFEQNITGQSSLAKGKVVSADNSDVRQNLIVRTGTQQLQVLLIDGPYEGNQLPVQNPLSGKLEFDEFYKTGDTLLVEYLVHDGTPGQAFARGHYRLRHEFILVAAFCVFICIVAGWVGLKALLSFAFAALMIWKVLIPLFLKDLSPVPVALAVVAGLTASVSFLVGGFTRKGFTAFAGSFSGLLVAALLALLFSGGFHLHGAVRPYAETLLYSGYPHLDLTAIFLAGIFIACSGAVMDLAMDIAASMSEVKNSRVEISGRELFRSGMAVGRSVVGTMTTTLLLAYSGSYTFVMMNFMGQGWKLEQVLNLNFVASEILNVFVGSFGLVAVAPLTALAGAIIFSLNDTQKPKS